MKPGRESSHITSHISFHLGMFLISRCYILLYRKYYLEKQWFERRLGSKETHRKVYEGRVEKTAKERKENLSFLWPTGNFSHIAPGCTWTPRPIGPLEGKREAGHLERAPAGSELSGKNEYCFSAVFSHGAPMFRPRNKLQWERGKGSESRHNRGLGRIISFFSTHSPLGSVPGVWFTVKPVSVSPGVAPKQRRACRWWLAGASPLERQWERWV